MIHFDLPKEKSSIIKVIGVGGGGSNAVNHMFSQNIDGVNFIICNTDAQAIHQSRVPNKIQLGPHLTQGLGAGANPAIGKQATEESLEEIKSILEVNTKMAFITAGMGGGTGTGGAPIISKICKDLGILTVGIVTTPFSYEGKKRQLQAEAGINVMKEYVDTLLVISNDKLRHQFGNLKMKEAFAKADNVLATAAKCITDVINSTGQINVDFADVCTVMRNGGVAILGSAAVGGENRAQRCIEEALTSPLLNDNDIKGAKWILININSAEGEHEFTMDEVEIIQNYLLSHAGEGTDVILGLGYDNTLGDKVGITLIATGFEYKDPFDKIEAKTPVKERNGKVLMPLILPTAETAAETLRMKQEVEKLVPDQPVTASLQESMNVSMNAARQEAANASSMHEPMMAPVMRESANAPVMQESPVTIPGDKAPKVAEQPPVTNTPSPDVPVYHHLVMPEEEPVVAEIRKPLVAVTQPGTQAPQVVLFTNQDDRKNTVDKNKAEDKTELIHSQATVPVDLNINPVTGYQQPASSNNSSSSAASGGYLSKPANIYAEPKPERSVPENHSLKEITKEPVKQPFKEEDPSLEPMQLVFRSEVPAAEEPGAHQTPNHVKTTASTEEPAMQDEVGEQKRRAAERIQKLRNLSFNINAADPNNEFETVPAYIRRNLELYGTINNVENFYSNYEVKADENNKAQISTINTFLDGKKPD
ncbi:cell division protein FtsZ [Flavitalea antarctica]